MPTYTFKDTNTGEVTEKVLRISELDQFKADNPHLKTQIQSSGFVSDHQEVPEGPAGWLIGLVKHLDARPLIQNIAMNVNYNYGRAMARKGGMDDRDDHGDDSSDEDKSSHDNDHDDDDDDDDDDDSDEEKSSHVRPDSMER